MKNEWLTTLLKQKGLKLDPADLVSLLEEIAPNARNGALSYVLDWMRPFTAGMGLRVARLGDQHVELVLPNKPHNQSREGVLHEGVLFSAGTEAVRLLWERHAPFGEFKIFFIKSQFELRQQQGQQAQSEVRIRFEMLEASREAVLSTLRAQRICAAEALVSFFSDKDQHIGELHLQYEIHFTPSLSGSSVSNSETEKN